MAFSSCLKCYPLSLPHSINYHPSPLSFSQKPTSNSFISFASTQHHDQVTAPSPVSNSTPPTTLSQLPSDFTPKQLLDTLRRQTDESSALRIFEWASKQSSFTPSSAIYEEILRKLGKKPTSNSFISFASTQHHDQVTAPSPVSNSTPPTTLSQLPSDFTPKQLLDTLRRQTDESSALRIFEWASKQSSFTPSSAIYEEILRKLGKVGSFESMRSVLEEMKLAGCEISTGTFLIFIMSYAEFELYDEIVGVVEMMENEFGLKPDTHFCNFLLNVLVDGNKLKLVETMHSSMVSRGIKPDVSTFNVLIKALCKAHQIRPAILMMEEMPNYGLSPDEKTFTTLMQGYIEEGVSRNSVTYNSLIDGLCKSRRMEEASQLMDQMIMEGLKPDKFTYNSLLTYFCRDGDIKKAADIVQSMTSNGCEPDIVTYGTLIGGLCRAGRIEVASRLLRTVQMKGMVPTPPAYNPVIQALFKRKRAKEGMMLFREMMEKGDPPDAVTYKIVFRGLCNGGGPIGEAVDFVVEMMEKGFVPQFSSFILLAEGLCALAMEDTLIKLVDMVMEKAGFSDSEVSMIRGFLKIRKFQDALATLGDILDSRNPRKAYR
ncbi:pentatricopeptide repeat-containing protein [Quercus suber]|uniref:Pentatricopeptide repeat-containing protein n=1 Tax=Quercus suber TaxID=58331 RepID=A0AAW0LRX8_QUESU